MRIGWSSHGFMTAQRFYEWLEKGFIPFIEKNDVQLAVIVPVNGHNYAGNHRLSNSLKIILIMLYPNATNILHPLTLMISPLLSAR